MNAQVSSKLLPRELRQLGLLVFFSAYSFSLREFLDDDDLASEVFWLDPLLEVVHFVFGVAMRDDFILDEFFVVFVGVLVQLLQPEMEHLGVDELSFLVDLEKMGGGSAYDSLRFEVVGVVEVVEVGLEVLVEEGVVVLDVLDLVGSDGELLR